MTRRRWRAGWTRTVAGLELRVVPGAKGPDDLRIDWKTPNGWRAMPMSVGAILADFWFENEDTLYPPPAAGGKKYVAYLVQASQQGWESADATLKAEQAAKKAKPAPQVASLRCASCGSAPAGTFMDGSPRYDCGPHQPVYAEYPF